MLGKRIRAQSIYANTIQVHVGNTEILLDFKLISPEQPDPKTADVLVRIIGTPEFGECLVRALSEALSEQRKRQNKQENRYKM